MMIIVSLISPMIARILIVGLVFFIIINAIHTSNYKRKGWWVLLAGTVFCLYFMGGFVYDFIGNPGALFRLAYFSYPIIVAGYTLLISGFYFINSKKYNKRFAKYEVPKKKESIKYLFILYKYEDYYLLKKQGGLQKAELFKFSKSKYYHDVEIISFLEKKEIQSTSVDLIGRVTKVGKRRDEEIFCYMVTIQRFNEYLRTFDQVSKYKLTALQTDDFTRQLVLRMALKTPFEIKI
ncbi:MAG: hypothetical protein WC182_05025 [Bacilli bacterium]